MSKPVTAFDGHNDALLRMYLDTSGDPIASFINGGGRGHLDLPKARAGHLAGGFFAVFVPPAEKFDFSPMGNATYDMPLPPELELDYARTVTLGQVSVLLRLEAASNGQIVVCRTAGEIRAATARGALAALLHIEGVEAIDKDLHMLDVLYAAGLRSLGPVWSRNNIFAHGVPFRFPGSPDVGPGLTDAGRRLVAACNRLGVVVDLSHMNEQGFWDVAKLSTAPLVATHSNVHALTETPRNLTARQLDAIRDSDGVVGLNFSVSFLRPDGRNNPDTGFDIMLAHLDAMIERVGETRVALGSDFDGAMIPREIGDASGLPKLFDAMRAHGYGDELVERIAYGNWLSLLERTIG
ncbi:peptidase [Devosia epidermidihirudinis]|uniref:Peptidase n=1 Tax=Devosia epidermidihirudinis TaxID=1293439 RepID=A0A0F5QCV6_9HYPH|nr:dipeptidase [Devosia epidermidihirudinis]KKC38795.1 peptidase [Devosia epidermidihirudinis]